VIETMMGDEVVHGLSSLTGLGENEARVAAVHMHPLGHMGQPQDVANAIVFLASDKAAFMTGSEMVVDGGATAG
jgi:NAD(P)-dependent dehydrogenase (short-subunit alcohol dehydrogenase family)